MWTVTDYTHHEERTVFLGLRVFREQRISGNFLPLRKVLTMTRYSKPTDARDKVYAVLGLSNDGEKLVPSPTYAKSCVDVVCNLTWAMIRLYGSLNILFVCGSGPYTQNSGYPSWVPGFLESDRQLQILSARYMVRPDFDDSDFDKGYIRYIPYCQKNCLFTRPDRAVATLVNQGLVVIGVPFSRCAGNSTVCGVSGNTPRGLAMADSDAVLVIQSTMKVHNGPQFSRANRLT